MIICMIRGGNYKETNRIMEYLKKRVLPSNLLSENPTSRFLIHLQERVEKFKGFQFGNVYYYKGVIIREEIDILIYSTSIVKNLLIRLELLTFPDICWFAGYLWGKIYRRIPQPK